MSLGAGPPLVVNPRSWCSVRRRPSASSANSCTSKETPRLKSSTRFSTSSAGHPSLTSRWRYSSSVTKSHHAPKPTTVTAPSSTPAEHAGKLAHLVIAAPLPLHVDVVGPVHQSPQHARRRQG